MLNNIPSNAPPSMQRWVTELEKIINDLQQELNATKSQLNAKR